MADKKISALTAATTPLAGTEILPIVQSGATVQVANNDLRPKQIQSNATSGVLQIVGPAAASTRVMTVPDANFTAARTDTAQSFTGNQTFSDGNLIFGTVGKGVELTTIGGALKTFGWANASSAVQDLASLFSNVNFTNAEFGVEVLVSTVSTTSDGTSCTFTGLRTANGTWAFSTPSTATVGGGPTVTPSGSGSTLTLSFSVAGQYGRAIVKLIKCS